MGEGAKGPDERAMARLASGYGVAPEPRRVRVTHRMRDGSEHAVFRDELALAALLLAEAVMVGSGEGEAAPATIWVDCSDVFAWGCADAEEMPHAELEAVYDAWVRDPEWGTAVWCMRRRGEMPQSPVARRVREAGVWGIDAMGLRGNAYDGLCRKWAAERAAPLNDWENEGGSCGGAG